MAHKHPAGSNKAARFHLTATAAASLLAVLGTAQQAWAQADAALPAVQVTGSQYDADDVRPEGVTTATKTYMAPRDIPQTIDTLEVNK